MIDKQALSEFIGKQFEGTDRFIVDLSISPSNSIVVEIDSLGGSVDIDECVALTRAIEEAFSRDEEDYDLEVGSAGLTAPFKVKGQYLKNVGNEVEILTKEGKKLSGVLREVGEDSFTVVCAEKVKHEGAKRPVVENVERVFPYSDVKRVNYLLKF